MWTSVSLSISRLTFTSSSTCHISHVTHHITHHMSPITPSHLASSLWPSPDPLPVSWGGVPGEAGQPPRKGRGEERERKGVVTQQGHPHRPQYLRDVQVCLLEELPNDKHIGGGSISSDIILMVGTEPNIIPTHTHLSSAPVTEAATTEPHCTVRRGSLGCGNTY